jgi:hypothetical protein
VQVRRIKQSVWWVPWGKFMDSFLSVSKLALFVTVRTPLFVWKNSVVSEEGVCVEINCGNSVKRVHAEASVAWPHRGTYNERVFALGRCSYSQANTNLSYWREPTQGESIGHWIVMLINRDRDLIRLLCVLMQW